ncbi:MAG: VWA domain-containing protein [Bryobacteraceae bacterium]|nr:VWA domain-containing protein [Bryobacteraceae bacterium]
MLGRLLVVCLATLCLWGQQEEPPAKPAEESAAESRTSPIRVQVNEVIVPVTVTDDQGRFVSNLDEQDFKIFDQGVEQKVTYFNRERNQPVVVGFLIEQSNTLRLYWKTFQDTAQELVLALMPEDPRFSGYLISYGSQAELLVNTTHDPGEMVEKIRAMKPGGGAALFDAIYMACTNRELVEGEPIEPRRVIVIIGDGHDNASSKTLDEVLELAQRNLVTIHGVSTVSYEFNAAEEGNLLRLARETGGRVEYPMNDLYKDISGYLSKPSDAGNYAITVGTGGYSAHIAQGMFGAIAALQGEITTQYILRYTPAATDDPRIFRNVRVEVALPNVKIRHRKGYYPYAP